MALLSIFILFCAFQLYQIQNVSSSKTSSFKIDDFINQLMTSSKFSELTDIIAEKAAKKIKSVRQDRKQEHSAEKDFRKNDYELQESQTVKKYVSEKSKKGERSTKFGKINTDAFLKQDLKSGEILLNYKHMTDELKRSDHKTNTQKNGETLSDRDSKMHRDKYSEKPKHQSRETKIQPRKQLKTNKVYEEIQRNFNKINKSMDMDSSSGEAKHNNMNNTANDGASEEHEIFIKADEDVAPQVNVKKNPNSNESKHANSDEKNEVDTRTNKKPTKSNEKVEKNTKPLKTLEITNKEVEEHDTSIQTSKRISKNAKKYHESIIEQETHAEVTEYSEKSIEAYSKYESLNEKNPEDFNDNIKKYSQSTKYQENTNENMEISAKPVEVLIEIQPEKINLKTFGNMQNKNRLNMQKGTSKSRVQKSEAPHKAYQTTEHVEDYSDILNFEGAKDTLIKEPIFENPYPIISQENGKIYTHNYSDPDYKEYHDKFVSKGNFINT